MATYTITQKNQATIDPQAMKVLGLHPGDKVSYFIDNGLVLLVNPKDLIKKNKGMVKLPPRFKGKDLDSVFAEAKREYFKKSNSKV